MSQVKRERRKAKKNFIKGKACRMLGSGKSVAETASELPVSRCLILIEKWLNNCFHFLTKSPAVDRRQTALIWTRVVNATLTAYSQMSLELSAESFFSILCRHIN